MNKGKYIKKGRYTLRTLEIPDAKKKIKKEFETLSGRFIVLLNMTAENYFDVAMETAELMSKRGKGIYVTVSRPCGHISEKMQKRNINTDNISFIDCVSAMSGGDENKNYIFVESPSALEEICLQITLSLDKIISDEKFLIVDSISTLLIYNSIDSIKKFSMFLINKLKLEGVNGILMVIEGETNEELKQSLIGMCDKTIDIE